MTNVEEVKAILKKQSDIFGSINGDNRRYEAKSWYLTGVYNGILNMNNELLSGKECIELLHYIDELLKED